MGTFASVMRSASSPIRSEQSVRSQREERSRYAVSRPGDAAELEADRAAEVALRGGQATFATSAQLPAIQRKCAACDEGNEEPCATCAPLQRHADRGAPAASPGARIDTRIDAARRGGRPLDSTLRRRFEPRFGFDFGRVRLHADGESDALAGHVRSEMIGQPLALRSDRGRPRSRPRCDGAGPRAPLAVSTPGDMHEQEADRVAEQVMRTPIGHGIAAGMLDAGKGRMLQRQHAGRASASSRPALPGRAAACPGGWLTATAPSRPIRFADQAALDHRKGFWRQAIEMAYGIWPECVIGWITGTVLPPQLALDEVNRQRDAMMAALAADRTVQHGPHAHPIVGLEQHPANPGHRDFAAQERIWWGKFNFEPGKPFGVVSEQAMRAAARARAPSAAITRRCDPATRQQQGAPVAGGAWNPRNAAHCQAWFALTPNQRQIEILSTSSAPGTSRHHWGSDVDLFSVDSADWTTRGLGDHHLEDEHAWLQANARRFGFIQPFIQDAHLRNVNQLGYGPEAWHWSYYPIAQALLEVTRAHQQDVEAQLTTLWSTVGSVRGGTPFSFLQDQSQWTHYVTNVAQSDTTPAVRRKISPQGARSGIVRAHEADAADSTRIAAHVADQPGRPLPKSALDFFGQRMGYDFSDVRVHDDDGATVAAEGVEARAYTLREHIVFGRGQYSPETTHGRLLLAHELTHVLQQAAVGRSIHRQSTNRPPTRQQRPPAHRRPQAPAQPTGIDLATEPRGEHDGLDWYYSYNRELNQQELDLGVENGQQCQPMGVTADGGEVSIARGEDPEYLGGAGSDHVYLTPLPNRRTTVIVTYACVHFHTRVQLGIRFVFPPVPGP